MQIAELMRLIPDDGSVEIKNNSGQINVRVELYNLACESMISLSSHPKHVDDLVELEVRKMVELIKQKLYANS